MSLAHARVETRLPTKDLARAKRWYAEMFWLFGTPPGQDAARLRTGDVFERSL
jgi:hypothetical protein